MLRAAAMAEGEGKEEAEEEGEARAGEESERALGRCSDRSHKSKELRNERHGE